MSTRVVIVGAGISGLSAAHTVLARARERGVALNLQVLEALPRAGGHVLTVRDNGFVVEAGPNGFLDREPGPVEIAGELGIESKLIETRPEAGRRFIVRGSRLRRVPDAPPTMLTSDALSPWGKIRLLIEPWAKAAPKDVEETVFEFARRRIGAEAAEQLVDAAISGISAGDSKQLSVSAAFPLMIEMEREHGSLIRAMMKRKGKKTRIMSFSGGLATLVEALREKLADHLRTGVTIAGLARDNGAWRIDVEGGEPIVADHVVLATPANASARIVSGLDAELSGLLGDYSFAGLSLVALAYRKSDIPRSLEGYGYLVTRGEAMRTLGVVWESSLFEGRAPNDMALLRAFVGGVRSPRAVELSKPDVEGIARQELERVMSVTAKPIQSWTFRFPQAIAQYTRGHLDRVAKSRELTAQHPGLHLVGTSYDGISFSAAVTQARRFADRFVEQLDSNTGRHEDASRTDASDSRAAGTSTKVESIP